MKEDKRQQIIDKIPGWYNPYAHAIIPSIIGVIIIFVCGNLIKSLSLLSLISIPITLFCLFGFEWLVHRFVLHARQPLLGMIYELHELSHHVIYTNQKMTIRDKKELYYVLMPPYAILIVFCLVAPLAFGLGLLFSLNVACLIIITSMIFFLSYEWLHFSYHQPVDSWIGRNKLVCKLRKLHQIHHNPKLMKRYNFNVTIPVFDLILGTYWRKL